MRVGTAAEVEPLAVSLPWLVRDALVHFLSPRGLEQFTGGAWGTRDVTQGPLELLLALDRQADARTLLLRVFAAQNPDGTWPQAFGFLPGDEHFRMEPSHGDVVHWPVLAVGRYLLASGDATLLEEVLPWYTTAGAPAVAGSTMRTHLERALAAAREHFLPGTHLVAYGHGDWNDSLQPADPAMAATMSSAWTATLHHQSLRTLADGLESAHGDDTLVEALRAQAEAVATDLRRYLLVDGELAGYAQLDPPDAGRAGRGPPTARAPAGHRDRAAPRLAADDPRPRRRPPHPRRGRAPRRAGPRAPHGGRRRAALRPAAALLGWAHAPLPARRDGHLHGARDRAHVRPRAPALVRGDGPLGRPRRPVAGAPPGAAARHGRGRAGARRRQANAYPSSSDAACLDRAEFAARYAEVLTGATGLEAGWRIYSSGPGVLLRIVVHSVLGIRRRAGKVEIDPVLPAQLDGLTATVPLAGGLLRVRYSVGHRGHGPSAVRLGGRELAATRTANPYRVGGLVVDLADLDPALRPDGDELEILLP